MGFLLVMVFCLTMKALYGETFVTQKIIKALINIKLGNQKNYI